MEWSDPNAHPTDCVLPHSPAPTLLNWGEQKASRGVGRLWFGGLTGSRDRWCAMFGTGAPTAGHGGGAVFWLLSGCSPSFGNDPASNWRKNFSPNVIRGGRARWGNPLGPRNAILGALGPRHDQMSLLSAQLGHLLSDEWAVWRAGETISEDPTTAAAAPWCKVSVSGRVAHRVASPSLVALVGPARSGSGAETLQQLCNMVRQNGLAEGGTVN